MLRWETKQGCPFSLFPSDIIPQVLASTGKQRKGTQMRMGETNCPY